MIEFNPIRGRGQGLNSPHAVDISIVKNEACRRAVCQQVAVRIGDPPLGGAYAPAPVQDEAFGPDDARCGCDRTHQRNLELERRLSNAVVQRGPDRVVKPDMPKI